MQFLRRSDLRDVWIHLPEHSLLYLPIPKNANTYLKSIMLFNAGDAPDFKPGYESPAQFSTRTGYRHKPVKRRILQGSAKNSRFLVLRDPRARLVSAFIDKFAKKYPTDTRYVDWLGANTGKKIKELTLVDLLEVLASLKPREMNKHLRPQSYWVDMAGGHEKFDFIGRVERLEQTERFLTRKGLSIPQIETQSLSSKVIFKTTSYSQAKPRNGDLTIGKLSMQNTFPSAERFFGAEEATLFEKVYQEDLALMARCDAREEPHGDH